MHVGSKMQQPMSSDEFNYGYASRLDSQYMTSSYGKTAYFVNLPNHPSRLSSHTNTHNFQFMNSGNIVMDPSYGRSMNQYPPHCSSSFSQLMDAPVMSLRAPEKSNLLNQSSFTTVDSLNKVASRLGFQPQAINRQFPANSHQDGQFLERGAVQEDQNFSGRRPEMHRPNDHLLQNPQQEFLVDPQNRRKNFYQPTKNFNSNIGLRRRNSSDTSTESFTSRPSKRQKVSEYSEKTSSWRGKPRHKLDSHRNRLSKSHPSLEAFKEKTSYRIKRLDLGTSIEDKEAHQELTSRLKAMVYSVKMLNDDQSIVIPSLPLTLSLSNSQ
jgi:hypothetical protein